MTTMVAVSVYEQIRLQQRNARRLLVINPSDDTTRLRDLIQAKDIAFRHYAASGSASDFAELRRLHTDLKALVAGDSAALWAQAQADSVFALDATRLGKAAAVASGVAVFAWLVLTTWLISRRMRAALMRSEAARQLLAESSASIVRRNEQFYALYEVAVENADDADRTSIALSAVSSARRLLQADHAVLWLQDGNELEIAATSSEIGSDQGSFAVNRDLVGRVATRGRSQIEGAGAAVIVPLIVRARVVGVVECWSGRSSAFGEDDRKLLEMLAAHVAPTLHAADRYHASEALANTDSLTGLWNRRQLLDDTLSRYAPALENGETLSAVMLDIDHFKSYNDRHGHQGGDEALRVLGGILKAAVRGTDRVYRYGGEEFLLLLEQAEGDDAWGLVERLRQAVEATADSPILPAGFTISAGLATAPAHGEEFAVLVERADVALYESKSGGRNRATVWSGAPSLADAA